MEKIMADITAVARLGNFAADCATCEISSENMNNAAFCLLDALGLALLARAEPTVAAMTSLAPDGVGPGSAQLWTDGRHSGVAAAIEVNATAVHGHSTTIPITPHGRIQGR